MHWPSTCLGCRHQICPMMTEGGTGRNTNSALKQSCCRFTLRSDYLDPGSILLCHFPCFDRDLSFGFHVYSHRHPIAILSFSFSLSCVCFLYLYVCLLFRLSLCFLLLLFVLFVLFCLGFFWRGENCPHLLHHNYHQHNHHCITWCACSGEKFPQHNRPTLNGCCTQPNVAPRSSTTESLFVTSEVGMKCQNGQGHSCVRRKTFAQAKSYTALGELLVQKKNS